MDSSDSKEDGPKTRRRSLKQASTQASYIEDLKARTPIKRTQKMREDDGASRAVHGPKENKGLTKEDEDESPTKKQKLKDKERVRNERGDGLNQTDDENMEMGENEDQDQEMNSDEEAEQEQESSWTAQPGTEETYPVHVREENLESEVSLNKQRLHLYTKVIPKPKEENYEPVTKCGDASRMGAVPLEHQQLKNRINMNYQNPVQKQKNPPGLRSHPPTKPQKSYVNPTIQLPITNQTNNKYTESKSLQKPVPSKASPAPSSRGWISYMCKWLLILELLLALGFLGFLAYQKFLHSHLPQTDEVHSKSVEKFDLDLAALQALFPSQRSVFWKRSGKHLKNHLKTVNPTEPVSVILTAGLQAETTLGCLARRLAAVYSATHNASILEINGTTKRAQDSKQVKLDIDEELREAFEGDKPAAVVHRFEELPPGSTLIFYRYCDHENAAYKKVFLVFTVMLSVDEIAPTTSLSAVEDMVYDHVKQKFVISDKSTVFNQMDVDKLSGLWSRISHLILPVAAEEKIEQQGCGA
ncbi:torsin-1A-interacting protein 1 isoform X2 [Carassius auratus]|uniref:Torsin-1A-interacting protein 1 isoform X2 n=1 Tax=Carassius auratus TaxID=7957 RepID=A0A6P6PX74_CARAU|nr:torsin-1A-interacting protein 1-like isoform X2 [Carassius auratus]